MKKCRCWSKPRNPRPSRSPLHCGLPRRPQDHRESPESVQNFGITFPVWTGISGDALFRLSKGEAVPATVFIDRDGTIQSQVSGQITQEELQQRLAWLTGDRTRPKPASFVSHMK